MTRKKLYKENLEEETLEEIEYKSEDNTIEPQKVEIKKKAYKVILVTETRVIYEISPNNCTTTPNIWGDKLVLGDIIYLEE